MKAIVIVMNILGCDDGGANCLPVATVAHEWQTISQCDKASERELKAYQNISYPMVVAVCQSADDPGYEDAEQDAENITAAEQKAGKVPEPPEDAKDPGLTGKAVALVKTVVPSKKELSTIIHAPVRVVTGTYNWVSRKVSF